MSVGPCVAETEFHDGQFSLEPDVLLHFAIREELPAGPVSWPDAGVEGGFVAGEFQHGGGIAFVVAALHGVPSPGFIHPFRSVILAVIALLDEPAVIVMVEEVFLRAAGGEPRNAGTAGFLHSEFDLPVVEKDPVRGIEFCGRRISKR